MKGLMLLPLQTYTIFRIILALECGQMIFSKENISAADSRIYMTLTGVGIQTLLKINTKDVLDEILKF